MSKTYVISDTHWGHRGITKFRKQFETNQEHDQYVLDKILTVSGKRNSLWLLGDCFFDYKSLDYLGELCSRFENINFILGNHDTDRVVRQEILRIIIQCYPINKVGSLFKYKRNFWLSHHPIHPDELRGKINIHGHVHNATIKDKRYINVCCEAVDYVPQNIQDLLMRTKSK